MGKKSTIIGIVALAFSYPIASPGKEIDFARDIRPILSDKCFFCHGPDEEHRKAKLRLDLKSDAFADKDGVTAFVPGDLAKSESWHRIISDDPDEVMPPPKAKKPLSAGEIELIKQWIESGAEWTEHWSFSAPEKPEPPSVESRIENPIDQFIHAELAGEPITPSPEADRRTLLRRITFDLTGLPPTLEELDAFLGDKSEKAYETVVDRLLASPRFGERMALMWLDAARYGDTSVMHADGPRDMWPWRDWVVNAYNENQPYDQFSIEQLAGDLLPDPTNAQLVASGFNRNHPSSDEGGAIAEELRVSYVADRVKTTSNVWLGLSMECVQCHDHKYDPISHREYYQFYAFFNNTTDPGMQTRKGNQAPFVEVVTDIEEEKLEAIEKSLTEKREATRTARVAALKPNLIPPGEKEPLADVNSRLANLKHFFPLDDVRGRIFSDAVGGKDLAGEVSSLKEGHGKHNTGVKLVASRTYDTESFTEFDHKSKFTFTAWLKPETENTGGAVFAKMDVAKSHRGYDFWMQGGKPGMHLINTWPKNAVKVVAKQQLPVGKWSHVAISYDGGGKPESVKIYIDGKPVEHTTEGAGKLTATMKNDVPFRLGGRSSGGSYRGSVDDIHIYDRALSAKEISWTMRDLVGEARETLAAKRTPPLKKIVENSVLNQSASYLSKVSSERDAERERTQLLSGKATSMVMKDNPPDQMRTTYILDRGQYDSPREDEAISPGTPAILPPMPEDAPANRLGLARWLFADEHPLTSRVAVNQLWQLFMGHGIVRTPADFGAQGEFPTHPKLLDWLAVDFRESGWDTKRMIRQIVTSNTYRQSSDLGPQDLEHDPDNRLLGRASRPRLPAEMIRDNALAVSGLLVEQSGGPGVKPYQPPGLWAEVGLGGNPKFVQDKGDKLFRRTLYTYWKRSAPPPAMVIFDAPNRETCVIQRPITNTPLQALALMNDVQMIEASRHFAERVLKEGGDSDEAKASWAFELATAREPGSGELPELLDVYRAGIEKFGNEDEKATALLNAGDSERDESLPKDQHAAWTVVASMLLNLDETMTRN